ncbi:MAG: hypothetical protein QGH39_12735, partial [Candidatus Thermoplasmatota archaeon]|nr:hypothetical protein [Candidatus Thermoplasmatota archaeon]
MESDLESEKELVTLSPVKDIQESIKKVRTSSSEVIFKDLLALTDRPEETKVPNTELRKPDSPPVEWSNEDTPGGVSHFQAKPVDDIETFVSISPNRISDSMSGLGFSSEDKLVDKAPEPPVVLKPAVKRQKKAVVISVMRKTRKEEPHEVGTGALQRDRAKQDRNIRIDHNSTTFDRSPVVQFDEPTDSPSAEKLGLIKRTGDKSRSPPEMGFLRTKIPSVIYREDAWFTYKDENGILTYIALEKATRRYRKRLSFLSVLMLLVSIISVLSFAAVGFSLYAACDLWFLMLFPLGLSLGVLFVLFIVRFSLRPHRIVSLMKHYYRVDVLAFTESSAVIYDHHDSVSDYSFHYSIFPFDEIRSELSVINKASVSIHDEENAISSLAKCADLWNSKMKEFHEVPVATRNSFLYRCVESLLPYSINISHDDTMRTVREMTLPARWDEGKSLSMNPLFVQFCGLRGILDDFNSLIKRIDESISLHEERLRANITATKRYYSEFSRLTSKMTGMSGITFNDDNRLEIPLGENDPGPVTPLESIIRKFGDETRGKREWIAEEYDGKTKDLQEAMEAEIENERNELGGKSSEIDFQIRELELETEGLQKEIRHIERSMEERGPEISETSDKDGTNREKERLELECVRILDKLERNEKMLALLTKRATELDNDLDAKILKIEKVYKEKKGP